MPRFEIGSAIFPKGKITSQAMNIPDGVSRIDVKFDSTNHLNAGTYLTVGVETSMDGGATWQFVASSTRSGGMVFDEDGKVLNEIGFSLDLPPGPGRKVRYFIETAGGSFISGGGRVDLT